MDTLTLATGLSLIIACTSYIILIGFFTFGWYGKKLALAAGSTSELEKVSVVIAAKNEGKFIVDLLKDLLLQDYPEDLTEIIIVDDHSTDQTHQVVSNFIDEHGLDRISLFKDAGFTWNGKKSALTKGISQSTGKIILTTDADCRPGQGWISGMVSRFREAHIMMVFGPVSYFPGNRLSIHFQSLEYTGLMASGAGAALAGHPFMCSGASLAYRKDAFNRVNGFKGNEKFISGDDVFLMHKMKKEFGCQAIRFCMDKEAIVHTFPVEGILKFIDQRIRWASKSSGYDDFLSIATAVIVFTVSLFMAAAFFSGFISPVMVLMFLGFILVKSLADLPLMWGVTGFTGQRKLMKWYLPFQLVYPFYVVVAGVLSLARRRRW